jgi:hypothetical protein
MLQNRAMQGLSPLHSAPCLGAMLSCLSINQTFIELMVTPKQCFPDLTYGIIIGQESMRLFVLDMSVHDNTLSWGCLQQRSLLGKEEISMISWDYWMVENILKQKSQLNKQVRATNDKDTDVSNNMFVFGSLEPIGVHHGRPQRSCMKLNKWQQSSNQNISRSGRN